MTDTVDVSKVTIRAITKAAAREMIVRYHYAHRFSSCRYALGVFYTNDTDHPFFDGANEQLIGCLVYGHPVCNKAVSSVLEAGGMSLDSVLELTRLFVHDGYGKNIESFAIARSFEWLQENDPAVKVLISYADPEQGHLGRIYQATNWLYQGCGASKLMPDYSLKLTPDGPWIHSRTVGERFGPKNLQKQAQTIGHRYWKKEETAKHRYLYFLCNRGEKRQLLRNLKLPILPYPKEGDRLRMPVQQVDWVNDQAVATFIDEDEIR